ncbi:hypothetical protein GFL86_25540 [Rhizobium laguerreae]|nr:hypothetical protein [Rhizobium laguerreae]
MAAKPATPPDVPDDVKEHVKEDDIDAGTIFAALGSAGHLQLKRTKSDGVDPCNWRLRLHRKTCCRGASRQWL